jgi:hypothetical protein
MIEKGCFNGVILYTLIPKVIISCVSLLFGDYVKSFVRIVNKVQRLLQRHSVRIRTRKYGPES